MMSMFVNVVICMHVFVNVCVNMSMLMLMFVIIAVNVRARAHVRATSAVCAPLPPRSYFIHDGWVLDA